MTRWKKGKYKDKKGITKKRETKKQIKKERKEENERKNKQKLCKREKEKMNE